MDRRTYADHRLYASAFGKEAMAPIAPILIGLGKRGKGAAAGSDSSQDHTLSDSYWTRGRNGRQGNVITGKTFANQASFEFWRSVFVTPGISASAPDVGGLPSVR